MVVEIQRHEAAGRIVMSATGTLRHFAALEWGVCS